MDYKEVAISIKVWYELLKKGELSKDLFIDLIGKVLKETEKVDSN